MPQIDCLLGVFAMSLTAKFVTTGCPKQGKTANNVFNKIHQK